MIDTVLLEKVNGVLSNYLYKVITDKEEDVCNDDVSVDTSKIPYIISYKGNEAIYIDGIYEHNENTLELCLRLVFKDRVESIVDCIVLE